ncbi:MAG: hypothetical protein O9972_63135 [Burkholderiales bacterium]|nr:hypothetical protein [Burkholderiales bacterium]
MRPHRARKPSKRARRAIVTPTTASPPGTAARRRGRRVDVGGCLWRPGPAAALR